MSIKSRLEKLEKRLMTKEYFVVVEYAGDDDHSYATTPDFDRISLEEFAALNIDESRADILHLEIEFV